MNSFINALKQLLQACLAVALTLGAPLVPALVCAFKAEFLVPQMFMFPLARVLSELFCDMASLKRGTMLLVLGSTFFALNLAAIPVAYVLHVVFTQPLSEAIALVHFSSLPFMALLAACAWILGGDEPKETTTVQRGRTREESPVKYLILPDEMLPHEEAAYIPVSTDVGDSDTYARYLTISEQIPESEYDPTYVFDVRTPYRLPLRKDSMFRKFLEATKGAEHV